MAADHHRGVVVAEVLNGGQCRRDPEIIGDLTVAHRHVEVGAQQDAPAAQGRQVFEARYSSGHVGGLVDARRRTGFRQRR